MDIDSLAFEYLRLVRAHPAAKRPKGSKAFDDVQRACARLEAATRDAPTKTLSLALLEQCTAALQPGAAAQTPFGFAAAATASSTTPREDGSLAADACALLQLLLQGSPARQQQAASSPGLVAALVADVRRFGSRGASAGALAQATNTPAGAAATRAAGAVGALAKHLHDDQAAEDVRTLLDALGQIAGHAPGARSEIVASPGLLPEVVRRLGRRQGIQSRSGAAALVARLLAPPGTRDAGDAGTQSGGQPADSHTDAHEDAARDALLAAPGLAEVVALLVADASDVGPGPASNALTAALLMIGARSAVAGVMMQQQGFLEGLLRFIAAPFNLFDRRTWAAAAEAPSLLRELNAAAGGFAAAQRAAAVAALKAARRHASAAARLAAQEGPAEAEVMGRAAAAVSLLEQIERDVASASCAGDGLLDNSLRRASSASVEPVGGGGGSGSFTAGPSSSSGGVGDRVSGGGGPQNLALAQCACVVCGKRKGEAKLKVCTGCGCVVYCGVSLVATLHTQMDPQVAECLLGICGHCMESLHCKCGGCGRRATQSTPPDLIATPAGRPPEGGLAQPQGTLPRPPGGAAAAAAAGLHKHCRLRAGGTQWHRGFEALKGPAGQKRGAARHLTLHKTSSMLSPPVSAPPPRVLWWSKSLLAHLVLGAPLMLDET